MLACGIVPTLNWIRKRWWPKISCWNRIFSITCSGLPTKLEPWRSSDASNCARAIGGHPRSRPILSMTVLNAGNASSAAACDVSAMKPCELMLSARRRVAVLLRGAAVQLGERREALRLAADDRERHRQAERAGAHDRLRRAADRDPHGQRVLQRARVHALAVERRRGGGRTT